MKKMFFAGLVVLIISVFGVRVLAQTPTMYRVPDSLVSFLTQITDEKETTAWTYQFGCNELHMLRRSGAMNGWFDISIQSSQKRYHEVSLFRCDSTWWTDKPYVPEYLPNFLGAARLIARTDDDEYEED